MYFSAFCRTTLLLAVVTGLFACSTPASSPRYYFPAPATVLDIEKKHDCDLRSTVDWQPSSPSVHVQAGYSPLKHVALAGYYAEARTKGLFDSTFSEWESQYRYGEIGMGIYWGQPGRRIYSLYGGTGFGRYNTFYDGEKAIASEVLMQSYYVQPGILLHYAKHQLYFGCRFQLYNFYSGEFETRTPLDAAQALNELVNGELQLTQTAMCSYIFKPKKIVSFSVNVSSGFNIPSVLLPSSQSVTLSISAGVDLDEVFREYKNK